MSFPRKIKFPANIIPAGTRQNISGMTGKTFAGNYRPGTALQTLTGTNSKQYKQYEIYINEIFFKNLHLP